MASVKAQISELVGYKTQSMVVRSERKTGQEVVLLDDDTFESCRIRSSHCDLMVEF